MQPIIAPIATDLILQELTPDKLLRPTNKGRNSIYVFSAHEAPNTMREVGRLREEAFRAGGGARGWSVILMNMTLTKRDTNSLLFGIRRLK